MDMHTVIRSGAVRLPTLAIAAAIAGTVVAIPLSAQSAGAGQAPSRVKRDSMFVLHVTPGSLERQLKLRLDSFRVVLDRAPIASADREQLRTETERLVKVISDLSRNGVEFNARMATGIGAHVNTVIARGLAEGGMAEGLRRFQVAAPRGWIGIVAEAPNEYRIIGENQVIRYLDYPSIVSVDPNSPAARAGINAGDVLVAYDRSDVRDHEINLSRLLVPDRRLTVTVRRDGETKDYEMKVARASAGFIRQRFETNLARMDTVVVKEPLAASRGGGVAAGGFRGVPAGATIVAMGPMATRIDVSRPGMSSGTLWGAQLSTINSGLGRSLGVASGVLVISVLPATPADRSGLDDGDIIVKANGQPVADVVALWKASAARDADRTMDLEVIRDKKSRKLTLRWAK